MANVDYFPIIVCSFQKLFVPSLFLNSISKIDGSFGALLALLTFGSLAIVGYADFVVKTVSLGYLYIVPLVLGAFVFRLPTAVALVLTCGALADWLGPFEHTGFEHTARNILTLAGFAVVVVVVDRLSGQRIELTQIVQRQRDELEREIKLAADVQQRLLPANPPEIPGFDIAGQMIPARIVGGDYFDYIDLPAGGLGLAIADVAGKGVAASLLMSSVEMALRVDAVTTSHPNHLVQNLNQVLNEITDSGRYVTLFYGKLDVARSELEYTNAGHLPPLLLRQSSPAPIFLDVGGTVVGLFEQSNYEAARVRLEKGDVLVLYTDGVTETTDAAGEQFSVDRLMALVRDSPNQTAHELVNTIVNAVAQFRGDKDLEDDLTLVVVRITGT